MMGFLKRLWSAGKAKNRGLMPTYQAIVAQARQPYLFGTDGAPDDFDGRFDMLVVHIYLVLRRLKQDSLAEEGQILFDLFFKDMDNVLREIGVTDIGVGKKIKKMAAAFYGRCHAYDMSFEQKDNDALADAVMRNFTSSDASATRLAAYMRAIDAHLSAKPVAQILSPEIFMDFYGARYDGQ